MTTGKRIACAIASIALVGLFAIVLTTTGCNLRVTSEKTAAPGPVAASGVKEIAPEVKLGPDGLTSEQRNIKQRLLTDNRPGAVKHLYVFSSMSGQCILYSTVREKVTSSGKRLTPTSVYAGAASRGEYGPIEFGSKVNIGGKSHLTGEMLQDDGTYGHSIEYLYWYDVNGKYMQMYVTGGLLPVISDSPLPVKSVTVRIDGEKD